MRILSKELENRELLLDKMLDYGFVKDGYGYVYERLLSNGEFRVIVRYCDEELSSRVIDVDTDEDYVLVDVDNSSSSFSFSIREEYEKILHDIIVKCSIVSVFLDEQVNDLICYIRDTYGDELEFLWEKFSDVAVVRHSFNRKWYCVFMRVSKKKLELDSDEVVDIIDLKCPKHRVDSLIDYVHIFPGYHMNKNSWITVLLDGGLDDEVVRKYLDISYNL